MLIDRGGQAFSLAKHQVHTFDQTYKHWPHIATVLPRATSQLASVLSAPAVPDFSLARQPES